VPDITSRQHATVRTFRNAARGEGDLVLLDGWHVLHDAVAADVEIALVAVAGLAPTPRDAALLERLRVHTDVITVTAAVMDAMSPVRTPSGVVALGARRVDPLSRLLRPVPPLVVVAVDVQDPGNVGAMVRSAEAGGGTGVVFAGTSADPWGWKALRAAMGSTFRLPVRSDALPDTLDALQQAGLRVVASVPRGGVALHEVDMCMPLALVVGGEGSGLDEPTLQRADMRVTIPMRAPVESLNVAVAAALLVYEARRQREGHVAVR
jgi:TrmH family RNA methyltransferase